MAKYYLDEIFKEKAECVKIYCGVETVQDKFEKNVEVTLLNPQSIKAIITDVSPASSVWKMPGIISEKTKQIIFKKKYLNLIKASQKIKCKGDFYYGYRINGRLNYVEEEDYIRCYIYIKKES